MILSRQLASVCGRVVGFELRACVQTTDHHCSAAGSESSRRTAPHGPACRPAAPSLCLYFVILSSSYYRISSVISCVCAPPSIRILLPSVAHQVLYPWFPLPPDAHPPSTALVCSWLKPTSTFWFFIYYYHIGSGKVSSVHRSVSCLSRFELRMRAILLLCQSVGHISEVLK